MPFQLEHTPGVRSQYPADQYLLVGPCLNGVHAAGAVTVEVEMRCSTGSGYKTQRWCQHYSFKFQEQTGIVLCWATSDHNHWSSGCIQIAEEGGTREERVHEIRRCWLVR